MKKNLEAQLKEALIEQEAKEMCKEMQKPKYKKLIKDFAKTFIYNLSKIDKDFQLEEKEIDEDQKELEKYVNEVLSNPGVLKQHTYECVKIRYLDIEQINSEFSSVYNILKKTEDFGEENLNEYKKLNERVLEAFNFRDKMLKRLLKIAEEEGLEKAITKETRYRTTREFFPTAGDYIKYQIENRKDLKDYFSRAQAILMKDGLIGKMIAGIYNTAEDIANKLGQFEEDVFLNSVKKEAKKIYGRV